MRPTVGSILAQGFIEKILEFCMVAERDPNEGRVLERGCLVENRRVLARSVLGGGASGGARLHKAFFPLSEGTKRSQKFEFFGNRLFLDFERQSDPPGPPKAIAP